ncbi:MAG TPA: hypothetical protein VFW05_02650 [Verrucomicrobiae bacterium]|nr:hypothetical protein [Verrucomicrobiae bacterium]
MHLSPEPRFLHLWFSHPAFDANTLNDVTLLDNAGESIVQLGNMSVQNRMPTSTTDILAGT